MDLFHAASPPAGRRRWITVGKTGGNRVPWGFSSPVLPGLLCLQPWILFFHKRRVSTVLPPSRFDGRSGVGILSQARISSDQRRGTEGVQYRVPRRRRRTRVNKELAKLYTKCGVLINLGYHYTFEEYFKGFDHHSEILSVQRSLRNCRDEIADLLVVPQLKTFFPPAEITQGFEFLGVMDEDN